MKKSNFEKQFKKEIEKKESLTESSKKQNSKVQKQMKSKFEKELKKTFENKKTKKELQAIAIASNERKEKQAKEKLLKEKHMKEGKAIEKKSKLENFAGLYPSKSNDFESFCFSKNDFFIHNIDLKENENEKKLLHIYNKIESIGKGMNLNDIEKIILENLKKRLILEYCNNFEKNLKKKNAKDIKSLNLFFANSNLQKYLANAKENESLNIFENEKENIFGKSSNNYESKYIEKINGKYILHKIGKLEKEKAKESLKEKKNGKQLTGKERKAILKEKNKLEKMKAILKEKASLKSLYNLKSKQIENSINGNNYLMKTKNKIERMKSKIFEKNGINLKEKELKEKLTGKILTGKEKKEKESIEKALKEFEILEKKTGKRIESKKYLKECLKDFELTGKELKAIEKILKEKKALKERKESIENKLLECYGKQAKAIVFHGKQAKEKELKIHIEKIKNCNGKLAYLQKYFESQYGMLLK